MSLDSDIKRREDAEDDQRARQRRIDSGDDKDDQAHLLAHAAEEFMDEVCTWMPAMSHGRPEAAEKMRKLRAAIKRFRAS